MARTKQRASTEAPPEARRRPETPRDRRRKRYPRWRAISLSLVYIVFALHIVHWKLTGSTLAPLELNEVMYTLELGIITAGFLFMCALVVGTLIFGRFFCSWACHIMVLQEACAWLLRKLGIRAKPIRLRLMLWVPPATAFYMFVWPQLQRAWESRSFPSFYFATDREGWASFVTNNFWRNLPGPWVIALTFLVCGVAMIYLLGSRTFCTYVCPYGAIFGIADRFSIGRIRVNETCKQCGRCTETCTSGVRVHEEVKAHGVVVNPACLKCMDCVSVCPQGALNYGFAAPALFKSYETGGRFGLPYPYSLSEEFLAAMVFVVVILSFRGLYSRIPFLLSLALGVLVGYAVVNAVRLATRTDVRMSTFVLKVSSRLTGAGVAFLGFMALLTTFVGHSAFVRYHEYNGLRQAAQVDHSDTANRELAASAHAHLLVADNWGVIANERSERGLVFTSAALGLVDDVKTYSRRFLARHPRDVAVRLTVAQTLASSGDATGAEREYAWILENADSTTSAGRGPYIAAASYLATAFGGRGDYTRAAALLEVLARLEPEEPSIQADLGSALAETGRFDDAIAALTEALRLDPSSGRTAYNLGTILMRLERYRSAVTYLEQAANLMPDDADVTNNLGIAYLSLGEMDRAELSLRLALKHRPDRADTHFNLARVLASLGQPNEAEQHLRTAATLDSRYAALLGQATNGK